MKIKFNLSFTCHVNCFGKCFCIIFGIFLSLKPALIIKGREETVGLNYYWLANTHKIGISSASTLSKHRRRLVCSRTCVCDDDESWEEEMWGMVE